MDKLIEHERLARLRRLLQLHLNVDDRDLAAYLLNVAVQCGGERERVKKRFEGEGVELPVAVLEGLVEICRSDANIGAIAGSNNGSNSRQSTNIMRSNPPNPNPNSTKPTLHPGTKRQLSSPERFELKQLIASGAIDPRKHPHLQELLEDDKRHDRMEAVDAPPVHVDVMLANVAPSFLRSFSGTEDGQKKISTSPIRIVKCPTGSLARAALHGTQSAVSRRERKMEEEREAGREQVDKKAVDRVFHDPIGSSNTTSTGTVPSMRPSVVKKEFSLKPKSIKEAREQLPIFILRSDLMRAIAENQILVVIGETGSGKTTQITQYLAEEGYCQNDRRIACTQPRRVAAMSVARRVAEEVGCRVGELVGYTIRFEDMTSRDTRIKYMTDGMLLRECLVTSTTYLKDYSVVILDEAHERTVNTDVLFGLLKEACRHRPDLRLIVTSATLDVDRFSSYFDNCPIFTIPGRMFPVSIQWSPEPVIDYLQAAIECCLKVHKEEPPGDILVFLTGQEEIDEAVEAISQRAARLTDCPLKLIALPVYSTMPNEQQSLIFEPAPAGFRKAVIATNIAETSVTIDGILYVVDSGFHKLKTHTAKLAMDTLQVMPISQAQARQRAGRAGRTAPGKCFRLYTQSAFEDEMLPSTIPEIQRSNLAMVVLTLKTMGIEDILRFDFMDRPPLPSMLAAMDCLFQLGALDDDGFLTLLGRKMSELPLEPSLSKCLLAGAELGCLEAVLTIVSVISAGHAGGGGLFIRPRQPERQQLADQKKAQFASRDGDLMTYLTVYNRWLESGRSTNWANEYFIQHRTLKRAHDIRQQLLDIMKKLAPISKTRPSSEDSVLIRRALCMGLFRQAARRDRQEQGGYKTILDDHPASIHPSSVLSGRCLQGTPPSFILYVELVMTQREFLRDVTPIDPAWLVDAAPTLYKHPDPGSSHYKRERIAPLHNRHDKNEEWRLSRQQQYYRAARSR